LVLAVVALDQASKSLIVRRIPFYGSVPVIPGFFDLTHIHNTGAIFGMFSRSGSSWPLVVLSVLSLAAIVLIAIFFLQSPPSDKLTRLSLALIMSGALGNQVDRFVRGYVIDFLDIHVRGFHWPTFNVADSCISVGAVVLLAAVFLRKPHASDPV
jgi:signal peptidase II